MSVQPSNLLLNSECAVKLADFGLARSVAQLEADEGPSPVLTDYVATRWCGPGVRRVRDDKRLSCSHRRRCTLTCLSSVAVHGDCGLPCGMFAHMGDGVCVTRRYRAPEILLGSTKYTYGVDTWSAGALLPTDEGVDVPASSLSTPQVLHAGTRLWHSFISDCRARACLRVVSHAAVRRRVHPGGAAGWQTAVPGHVYHEPAGPHPGGNRCAAHAHPVTASQPTQAHVIRRLHFMKTYNIRVP